MHTQSKWTNGSWTISWRDGEQVLITGPYLQIAHIDGGDFENILSALCAAFNEGKREVQANRR